MNNEMRKKIESVFLLQKSQQNWQKAFLSETPAVRQRIEQELYEYGPLSQLFKDPEITEIMVNRHDQVFYEKKGSLHQSADFFYSEFTFRAAVERLSNLCGTYMNREKPFVEAQYKHMRITLIFSELAHSQTLISIRFQSQSLLKLEQLRLIGFLSSPQHNCIMKILDERKNFIVIGATGSGKTTLLQALLAELPQNERVITLEDTAEIRKPNQVSAGLLTRQDPSRQVPDVSLDDLLKRALRLRPDRLVVGEIRGAEASTLLLALASGHQGSAGTLHAQSAQEALLRLEMLVQMGAPRWSLYSVRELIRLSLQNILVVEKSGQHRRLKAIYRISSHETNGLTLHRLDENN
jgi:pilus assembly protein CpaF